MTPWIGRAAALALALVTSAALGALAAQVPAQSPLVKPLDQYLVGDVFPRMASEASAETGRSWQEAANELSAAAQSRRQAILEAISAKKIEVETAKQQLRDARRERDLVRTGTLEGTVRNEEQLLKILEELEELSEEQMELAAAWSRAGAAMQGYTSTDIALDAFRGQRLSRPEGSAADERLGAAGVQAFRQHAAAMRELGESFRRLGDRTRDLAKERLDLLKSLEKGGHVQPGS